MFSAFFIQAAVSPGRQRVFRWLVLSHLVAVFGCVWILSHVPRNGPLITGCVLLTAGIVEGAMVIGWRLTQIPKSQALEFLLVTPMRPGGVLIAEAIVGLSRLALVTLSGLPVLVLLVDWGYLECVDVALVLVMPFTWGAITGLCLTAWAYESATVRRWAERAMLGLTTIYLVVGLLAGEHLADWLKGLPANVGELIIESVQAFHRYNPFAVVACWMVQDPFNAWERAAAVQGVALGILGLLLGRAALRNARPLPGAALFACARSQAGQVARARGSTAVLVGRAARDAVLRTRQPVVRGRFRHQLRCLHDCRSALARVARAKCFPDI